MPVETNCLKPLIVEEIRARGPITFARFMELALYHPEHGYYSRGPEIGKSGDYYTSPHVSALFGQLVGRQLEEMWERLGRPGHFSALEMGAGHGFLAEDILDFAEGRGPFMAALEYRIIEASAKLREQQASRLGARVAWVDSLTELASGEITGCLLSNELVDSFPVHRVKKEKELREVFVEERDGELGKCLGDLSTPALEARFARLGLELPEGMTTDVNLAMTGWISEVARVLDYGFVLTMDYGLAAADLYSPGRMKGTLRAYRGHRLYDQVLDHPGEQDLTCHVDFTTLGLSGEDAGLTTLGFTDQTHFLLGIGEADIQRALVAEAGAGLDAARERAKILSLIHPEAMGKPFRVLIQYKGEGRPELGGLENARGQL